jgi:hypothetical protein
MLTLRTPMDSGQAARRRARADSKLPLAENWLATVGPQFPPRPWRIYPLEGLGWLRKANSLELTLRRLWRRLHGLWPGRD